MVLAISRSVRLIIAPGKFNLKTAIRILHSAQKAGEVAAQVKALQLTERKQSP